MQRAASFAPESHAGVRDALVALLTAAVAAALVVPVLTHTVPHGLLPVPSARPDYAYNVRLLKLMLLVEGAGLVVLAGIVALAGGRVRRLGGAALLEKHAGTGLALLFAAHVVGLLFYLPPQQILSPEPVNTAAHAAKFYRTFAAHRLLSDGIRLWGYDPYFMAGYPAGTVFDLDTRGGELFAHTFAFLGLAYASKAYLLLVQLLVPFAIYATARLLGASRGTALLAAYLAVLHWHAGRPFLGYLRWSGMHSYLLAVQLALLGTGLAVRFFDPDHRVRALCCVSLVGVAAVLGFVQPEGLVLLAPGVLFAYVLGAARLRRRDHAALWLGLGILLALHSSWIVPLWRQRHLLQPPTSGMQLRGAADLLAVLRRPTSALLVATLLLGAAGLWREWRRTPRAAPVVTACAVLWLIVATWGSHLGPLSRLETARVLVPLALLLCVPAAAGLQAALRISERALGRQLVTVTLLAACTLPPFLAILDTRFFYAHRLDATLDARLTELLRTLDDVAPQGARVLFESTAGVRGPLADGTALEALVPLYTHREVLGGPQPGMLPRQSSMDFGRGQLGGRPFSDWSAEDFTRFVERYNVGAAVAWSIEGRLFLARQGSLTPAISLHGFDLFVNPQPPGWLLRGTAHVRANYDRIELADVQGEELILKYHWMDGLRATPDVPLRRVEIEGDPVGFIGVRPRGCTHLILHPGR